MDYRELDTPALLIDRERLLKNLADMQAYADGYCVALRPHTKTHKMPYIARLQLQQGACGIAVAKVGEAEAMFQSGIEDILIANEIVGSTKLARIARLVRAGARIAFGVDDPAQVRMAEEVFSAHEVCVTVLVEIEVGENRSGVIGEEDFLLLLDAIRSCGSLRFGGIFSHDGNSYHARDLSHLRQIAQGAQQRTLRFAALARAHGMPCETVSYGATPTFMNHVEILPGITELRPGTYALMDTSQANAIGTLERCAATVLSTVISKPTDRRVILDVGAKGLTMQTRRECICAAPGLGTIFEFPRTHIDSVFDEHAIVCDPSFREAVAVGDKVRILPVHICPVCNLYERAYLLSGGEVVDTLEVSCRGKLQ